MEEKRQVAFEVEKGVMKIRIDNPETKNGLNYIGIEQLAECYEYAEKSEDVQVMLITGNDRYFYTGGRVNPNNPGENDRYADAIERLIRLQDANKKPVVAAVSGDCLKAGMGVVAGADFAIAREGVKFGFPEIRMGGVPMMVMAETIDSMPKKIAMEAYCSSWEYTAEQMKQMGMLNAVVSKEEFWPTVEKYVHIFLDTPAILIELTRKGYEKLSKVETREERRKIAMKMLREECLPAMKKVETTYNV